MFNLDDKYYIDVDKFQFILKRKEIVKSGKREGEEVFYDEGYFTDFSRLLKRFCHLQFNSNIPNNIQEMLDMQKSLEEQVWSVGKSLNDQLKNSKEDNQ